MGVILYDNVRSKLACLITVISYQLSVISYQLSVISYQLSVISYQLSVISYQLNKKPQKFTKHLKFNRYGFFKNETQFEKYSQTEF
jgi:hypothetical protein